jgi:flagellar hook-associated protein 2
MANVSSVGIGSGVLTSDLIDQLVAAERAPTETRLDLKQESVTAELSLFGQIQSAVTDLRLPSRNLANADTFNQLNAVSNSSAFTVTTDSKAVAGTYALEVSSLAKSQSLSTAVFADRDNTSIGAGTLDITIAGKTTAISINSSNDTLDGVAAAINAEAGLAATASVLNTGSGFQLVISSDETGATNAIDISVTDTGDGDNTDALGLSQLAFNSTTQNLTENQAASDAAFLFNGIAVTRSSNTVDDLIEGLNFTLTGTNAGAPSTIEVERNTDFVIEKVEEFIEAYNSLRTLFVENSQVDPNNPAGAGILVGDAATRTISNQIRSVLSSAIQGLGNGSARSLAEIGITTNKDSGNLELNEPRLRTSFTDDPQAVAGIFAEQGRTSDSQISFLGAGINTAPGTYDISISQLATKGAFTGAASIAATTLIDTDNDTFSLAVDGVNSGAINLTAGSYNQTDLLAEIQTQLNVDANLRAAGVSVLVGYDASNQLTFTSSSFGRNSAVNVQAVDTNTSSTLGLAVSQGIDGLDVAGTINGVAATGNGQVLSAATGDKSSNIRIEVSGGALGNRGSVTYSEGVGEQLVDLITNFLDADGVITSKNDRLNAELELIAVSRQQLDIRVQSIEERLIREFTAADILVNRLNSTQDFISAQLDAIVASNNQDN